MRIVSVLLLLVVLASCGNSPQPDPSHATIPARSLPSSTTVETATTTPRPSLTAAAQTSTAITIPTPVHGVTPGAFCSPEGSTGVTKKGVTVTCKGPTPLRWRS